LKEVASPKRKKIKKHERDKRLKRLDKKNVEITFPMPIETNKGAALPSQCQPIRVAIPHLDTHLHPNDLRRMVLSKKKQKETTRLAPLCGTYVRRRERWRYTVLYICYER
jgi:hypothetical protein